MNSGYIFTQTDQAIFTRGLCMLVSAALAARKVEQHREKKAEIRTIHDAALYLSSSNLNKT
jgi:hypothetical protein